MCIKKRLHEPKKNQCLQTFKKSGGTGFLNFPPKKSLEALGFFEFPTKKKSGGTGFFLKKSLEALTGASENPVPIEPADMKVYLLIRRSLLKTTRFDDF